jgi:hypothetical protein
MNYFRLEGFNESEEALRAIPSGIFALGKKKTLKVLSFQLHITLD